VREQECLESDDLFAQLRDGRSKRVVLSTEDLDLLLQVLEPLLLALAAFQCSNSASHVSIPLS
jgi:hypothetical protein